MVTAFSQAGHLAVCLADGGAPYLGNIFPGVGASILIQVW